MKQALITIVIFIITIGVAGAQTASVPQLVNYQGKLTDANGNPYGHPASATSADLTFHVYTQPSGGDPVWGPQKFPDVPVVGGHFNVILGPVDAYDPDGSDPGAPAPRLLSEAFITSTTFLGVTISTGSEIAPRQQILSAPYTMRAENARSLNGKIGQWYSPVGAIMAYWGVQNPDGWLICDGRSIPAGTQYDALRTMIGGNNTPDLRGMFLRGAGQNASSTYRYDGDASRTIASKQSDQFQIHAHDHKHAMTAGGQSGAAHAEGWSDSHETTIFTRTAEGTNPTSGSRGDETRPNNIAVNFIIKY